MCILGLENGIPFRLIAVDILSMHRKLIIEHHYLGQFDNNWLFQGGLL